MIGSPFTIRRVSDATLSFDINNQAVSPSNFIALQGYPTMDTDIRNSEMEKEGQHGIWDFYSFYGKRTVIFEGVIVGDAESDVQTLVDSMKEVTALPNIPSSSDDGSVTIEWTDPTGRDVQLTGKLQSAIRFNRQMKRKYRLDFIMIFKCSDPTIESQTLTTSSGLRSYTMASILLPMEIPAIMDTVRENVVTVTNAGSAPALPKVRMYGSTLFTLNNPRITNGTTGDYMEITTVLNDETEYVEIDSKTGEVVNQAGADLSGSILAGSSFITIAVGDNDVYYTTDESDRDDPLNPIADRRSPTAVVEIDHRDAIL